MPPTMLIGESDFVNLRRKSELYVDKSLFVTEVLRRNHVVQLYPRPRRFGKTTNLSMLRYFLESGPDRSGYFTDLQVWNDPLARAHFQRHPVIHISFKGVKHSSWAEAEHILLEILREAVQDQEERLNHAAISTSLKKNLLDIANRVRDPDTRVLFELSKALQQATGEDVVVLIDEYDAPLLTAWQNEGLDAGYYDKMANWFRTLLEAALKDNPHLFRAVLTGILRVAKESMFSGLNNVEVYSLLARDLPEPFGFTQAEVEHLLALFGRSAELPEVQRWYNGYMFGDTVVYNPWSILHVLSYPKRSYEPYWINTSSNDLIRDLLLTRVELSEETQALLSGGSIEREIDENVVLRDLEGNHVWSLLLFSGYLKPLRVRETEENTYATLSIPNQEVRIIWRQTFRDWLKRGVGELEPFFAALLSGNHPKLEVLLTRLLSKHVSTHDVKETQAEAFYHAFVLGLLVALEPTYQVRSNREDGLGRSDVRVLPRTPGKPGFVIEFKAQEGRSIDTMAQEALEQIEAKQYTLELQEAGATPIFCYGISFLGKKICIKMAKRE